MRCRWVQSNWNHCGLLINITSLAQPFPPEIPQRKGPGRRADDASPAQAAGARIGAAALQESEEGRPWPSLLGCPLNAVVRVVHAGKEGLANWGSQVGLWRGLFGSEGFPVGTEGRGCLS